MVVRTQRWLRASRQSFGMAAFLVCAVPSVSAAEQERREHDAHEHGHGAINIVFDNGELAIELQIPAMNVVGFEHEPSTDQQRSRVDKALADFRNAGQLLKPSEAAECVSEKIDVRFVGMEHAHDEAEDEHKGHDDEKHAGEEHDDEKHAHEKHGDEKHDGEHSDETHSELHAVYHFHCDTPEKLAQINVGFFDVLNDMEALSLQLVTASSQSATQLRPSKPVVVIKQQ